MQNPQIFPNKIHRQSNQQHEHIIYIYVLCTASVWPCQPWRGCPTSNQWRSRCCLQIYQLIIISNYSSLIWYKLRNIPEEICKFSSSHVLQLISTVMFCNKTSHCSFPFSVSFSASLSVFQSLIITLSLYIYISIYILSKVIICN